MNHSMRRRKFTTITISTYLGQDVDGDKQYGPPKELNAILGGKQMTIHDASGDEVVSNQQIFLEDNIGFEPTAADLIAVEGVNAQPLAVQHHFGINPMNTGLYTIFL